MEALKGSPTAAFFAALLTTLLVTPWVKRLGWRLGAVARPDERRRHPEPIALWGGIAVFLGVLVAALLWRQPTLQDARLLAPSSASGDILSTFKTLRLSASFIGCGFLIVLLGMVDDRIELSPALKLLGQFVVVSLLWLGGVKIGTLPFTDGLVPLPNAASFVLTLIWVVGLINAINFIDGVDGLATGVCGIIAGSLFFVLAGTAAWAATASAALCGACLGFLRYNFHPAKIFLGDTGSMLLGLWLAMIAISANAKTAAGTTLLLPVIAMGVPVFDTLWAITRRTIARKPPWRADRGHIHHRLLDRGFTPVSTVLVLYSVSFFLGLCIVVWTWAQ
jgi:UDP-GlcNAc:undecaprenyl-phosphate GlcNAc-1-phosphate transferase